MKALFLVVSLVLAACGGKNEPQQPKPEPEGSFSGSVGNVVFSGTDSKDPAADKARAEAAIKLSK